MTPLRHATRHFEPRRVLLTAGRPLAFEPQRWRGLLVVVERGQLELEWSHAERVRFEVGDMLYLAGLSLLALHAAGAGPTLLLTLRRLSQDPG